MNMNMFFFIAYYSLFIHKLLFWTVINCFFISYIDVYLCYNEKYESIWKMKQMI